jgi:PAS domain S-box-containing protein
MHRETPMESLTWLFALLDSADVAVGSARFDGLIRTWNAAAERIYGYSADEVIGRHASLLAPAEHAAEFGELLARVARGERVEHHRTVRLRKSGERFDAAIKLSPLLDENDAIVGAAVVTHDLSVDPALEDASRQARRLEDLGRLATGVAHDFNNLLTVILASGGFALEDTTGKAHQRVQDMVQAAVTAGELSKRLLSYTRPGPRSPELVDLNSVVVNVAGVLRRLLGARVELVVATGEDPLPPVELDRAQAYQVIVNLVVNAGDAMPSGGRVTLTTATDGEQVVLSVSDEGLGMDEETKRRVFEPFFTTKNDGRGTGLGLATVHDIIAQAGGHITVASSPGGGSVFAVYLPAAEGRLGIAV